MKSIYNNQIVEYQRKLDEAYCIRSINNET